MVDRDLILRKLADLDQYLAQVSEYRGITVDEYRRHWNLQRIVERTLCHRRSLEGRGPTRRPVRVRILYEHAARLVDELGRLVGGWQRRAGVTMAPTAPEGRDVGVGYRPSRRVLEQQPDQLAHGEPERQHAGQPEQQHRVPLRE